VILRDDAYGMIKWKQASLGFDIFGLDFHNPDFVKYAEAYGARGYRVKSNDDLDNYLKNCLEAKGVHLIEVPVDYSENENVLIEELKRKTCLI
jgi:acetolactate synthase-1/2/3 large subunit